jgi:predicted dehydrogenase
MKKMQVAIVGCGWAGDIHAVDLKKLPDTFGILACCDPSVERVTEFGNRYGIPRRAGSLGEVLAMSDIDVVVICTPPVLHYPMVLEALAADKHVICEKPFTSSLEFVDAIDAAQARSKGRVMPIFQYRYGDGAARVRHVIQSGLAGKHYVSSIEVARTRGAEYYREAWRGRFATELGGVHLTQEIHINDLFYYLVGPASSVMSFKTTRVNPIEVEDCAVTSLRLEDGSLASVTSTLGSVGQLTRLRLFFEHVTFERNSDHDISKPAEEPWIVRPRTEEVGRELERKMAEIPPGHSGFARQYELFHEAIATGGVLPVTLADARASIELVTAMYYSDETGASVSLPIGPDHPRYRGWLPK